MTVNTNDLYYLRIVTNGNEYTKIFSVRRDVDIFLFTRKKPALLQAQSF